MEKDILVLSVNIKEGEVVKILDLDMDYFMKSVATSIFEDETARLSEDDFGKDVWDEEEVRSFLENNLGLSKNWKIRGRIVRGHNEALLYWKELIKRGELSVPFEVIHVDSHADLGLGYSSWSYIRKTLLSYPVEDRPDHAVHKDLHGNTRAEGIGDYLLFAIAYRWISNLVYCGNPKRDCNDYILDTLKNFKEKPICGRPVENTIQLLYNPNARIPKNSDSEFIKRLYIDESKKEPEVPFTIIPSIEDVHFNGDFDFAVLAQSPNYTPQSADFIMDIFRDYIVEE